MVNNKMTDEGKACLEELNVKYGTIKLDRIKKLAEAAIKTRAQMAAHAITNIGSQEVYEEGLEYIKKIEYQRLKQLD